MFPRWSTRVTDAMTAAGEPGAQVLAYVDTNLELVAEGEHAVARALAAIAPGQQLDDSSRAMHEQLSHPLLDALRAMDLPDPATTAELINAIVYSASSLIEAGGDAPGIRARAAELLGPSFTRSDAARSPAEDLIRFAADISSRPAGTRPAVRTCGGHACSGFR